MNTHSKNKLLATFATWEVPKDYADPMVNYLVYGFAPGSFFTSVLANDFVGAMLHSHPGNSIPALKNLAGWIQEVMPAECRGDYQSVDLWVKRSDSDRRKILEGHGLVFSVEDELMLELKGTRTVEPFLW